jgi:hypothetical protein
MTTEREYQEFQRRINQSRRQSQTKPILSIFFVCLLFIASLIFASNIKNQSNYDSSNNNTRNDNNNTRNNTTRNDNDNKRNNTTRNDNDKVNLDSASLSVKNILETKSHLLMIHHVYITYSFEEDSWGISEAQGKFIILQAEVKNFTDTTSFLERANIYLRDDTG